LAVERLAGILKIPLAHDFFPGECGGLTELPRQGRGLKIRVDESHSLVPAGRGS
jgi:hypothetical protein